MRNACKTHAKCMQNVCKMYAKRMQNACKMHAKCMQNKKENKDGGNCSTWISTTTKIIYIYILIT